MADPSHGSDARMLRRPSFENDHRRLTEFLDPGMSVLDVRCGTGATTAGIARMVGRSGRVVGVDRNEPLLQEANTQDRNQWSPQRSQAFRRFYWPCSPRRASLGLDNRIADQKPELRAILGRQVRNRGFHDAPDRR